MGTKINDIEENLLSEEINSEVEMVFLIKKKYSKVEETSETVKDINEIYNLL